MAIPIDPSKTWDYVLKADRDAATPTVFILATLDVGDEAEIQDRLVVVDAATKQTSIASGTQILTTLRKGLRGWRNFAFADGTEVPFKTNPGLRSRGVAPPTDETLGYLSSADRKELAEAIIERNTATEDERKDSSSERAS